MLVFLVLIAVYSITFNLCKMIILIHKAALYQALKKEIRRESHRDIMSLLLTASLEIVCDVQQWYERCHRYFAEVMTCAWRAAVGALSL